MFNEGGIQPARHLFDRCYREYLIPPPRLYGRDFLHFELGAEEAVLHEQRTPYRLSLAVNLD